MNDSSLVVNKNFKIQIYEAHDIIYYIVTCMA